MENFFTILTNAGLAAEAEAAATGIPVILSQMALGDGAGIYHDPDPEQTELVNEVWRGNLYALYQDEGNPYQYIADIIIPAAAPHFFVREAGLYTEQGVLYAVAKHPVVEKPQLSAGVNFNLRVRMIFAVSNADTVQIIVNTEQDTTINDALAPAGDTGSTSVLFSWLAHMIKLIIGKSSWRSSPSTTLEAAAQHIADKENPHAVSYEQVGAAAKNAQINDVLAPTADLGQVVVLLSHLAYMIRAITGKNSWRINPAATIENMAGIFASGTKMVFYQQAAPVGWTQVTEHNDKALRVVSGSGGGTGGTHDFSNPPSLVHAHNLSNHTHTDPQTGGHQLTVAEMPSHRHTEIYGTARQTYTSSDNWYTHYDAQTSGFTGYEGGNGAHIHPSGGQTGPPSSNVSGETTPTAFRPKYVDVIICIKN